MTKSIEIDLLNKTQSENSESYFKLLKYFKISIIVCCLFMFAIALLSTIVHYKCTVIESQDKKIEKLLIQKPIKK